MCVGVCVCLCAHAHSQSELQLAWAANHTGVHFQRKWINKEMNLKNQAAKYHR